VCSIESLNVLEHMFNKFFIPRGSFLCCYLNLQGGEKVMADYLQEISAILYQKGFSFSRESLNNLLDTLSDEKKEQLIRTVLSIREYKSPKRHYMVSDDIESRQSVLALSESILESQNFGFSRFDFVEEFFDDLTKEQRIAFLKLFITFGKVHYYEYEDEEYEDGEYEDGDDGNEEYW